MWHNAGVGKPENSGGLPGASTQAIHAFPQPNNTQTGATWVNPSWFDMSSAPERGRQGFTTFLDVLIMHVGPSKKEPWSGL